MISAAVAAVAVVVGCWRALTLGNSSCAVEPCESESEPESKSELALGVEVCDASLTFEAEAEGVGTGSDSSLEERDGGSAGSMMVGAVKGSSYSPGSKDCSVDGGVGVVEEEPEEGDRRDDCSVPSSRLSVESPDGLRAV